MQTSNLSWRRGSVHLIFLTPPPPPPKLNTSEQSSPYLVLLVRSRHAAALGTVIEIKNVVGRLRSSEWSSAFHRTSSAFFLRGHLCWPFRHHWLVNCYLCVEILRALSTAISMEGVRVEVKIELGHKASCKKTPSPEGFTHDWVVFVRGPESCDISHFVEKVVFYLHESFAKPKRGKNRKNIC